MIDTTAAIERERAACLREHTLWAWLLKLSEHAKATGQGQATEEERHFVSVLGDWTAGKATAEELTAATRACPTVMEMLRLGGEDA